MTDEQLAELLARAELVCLSACCLADTRLHGVDHLREVAEMAGRLMIAEGGRAELVEAVVYAGFLHDAGRVDDGAGNGHAHASAELAEQVLPRIAPHLPAETICNAIGLHADGLTTDEPIAAALWDADRLTLGRAGITPRLEFFSTAAGRSRARALLHR